MALMAFEPSDHHLPYLGKISYLLNRAYRQGLIHDDYQPGLLSEKRIGDKDLPYRQVVPGHDFHTGAHDTLLPGVAGEYGDDAQPECLGDTGQVGGSPHVQKYLLQPGTCKDTGCSGINNPPVRLENL